MSIGNQSENPGGSGLRSLEPQPAPKRSLASRISLLHLIAIASGIMAFLLILSWMRGQQDVVMVAVASQDIRPGIAIDGGSMIEFVEIPAGTVIADRMISPEEVALLEGTLATRNIETGEPILESDLRPLSTLDGLRAMSLPFALNLAVSGDIASGDRVDVIGVGSDIAWYAATDVEVIGVPGASASGFGGNQRDFAVLLAVTDVQALGIAEAFNADEIHLIRSTGAPATDVTTFLERRDGLTTDTTLELLEGGGGGPEDTEPPPRDDSGGG